ncbi:unnamed protein product [Diatraea saccharalis]|uniref:Uncharacterized protein n=1 Tax=Diatraea saccharalis TaxID=40085 RepID=A0A9N9WID6_9NEOP|nr:unnamed protein product [Diatraea saccharalis]
MDKSEFSSVKQNGRRWHKMADEMPLRRGAVRYLDTSYKRQEILGELIGVSMHCIMLLYFGFEQSRAIFQSGKTEEGEILIRKTRYEEMYTITNISPKSAAQLPEDVVLQTSQTESLAFRIEPSVAFNDGDLVPEDIINDSEEENLVRIARSVDPNDRESRSIHIEDVPLANNEIDNHIELHNKRKYYEIRPTKSLDYFNKDDEIVMSSDGFGDRLEFRFPGEGKRVPVARALTLPGPRIRPTAVQPIFATSNLNHQGRQNSEIQNIITGIVKLLNGNVNVQANSQLLNGRPGRPMASRINNRGPPRISDLPPLPEFDPPVTPPMHAYHPTKTPPPYPFDRPPHHGVNLPEQIVPPMTHRPGFHRPMPPWQRPRPRPPNRRPNPGLPIYKPALPPLPHDLPELEDKKPEEEQTVSENETSNSENTIHHEENIMPIPALPGGNSTEETDDDNDDDEEETTTVTETTSTSTTTTTTSTTTEATTSTTTTTTEKPTEKTTTTTEQPTTYPVTTEKITTSEKPKTDKPSKLEKDKKKDSGTDKDKVNKDKYKIIDEKPVNKTLKEETIVIPIIESSLSESQTTSTVSIAAPTPTEGLLTHSPALIDSSSSVNVVKTSSINTEALPSSQGIPYQPYRPRPGIVLDDTDFKPHGSRYRPSEVAVITAPETRLPGYGEIFDVTVSAIQGPGGKGASVHIENVNPLSGHSDHDDIIVSASGEQGFVSIDGKRTYLNLFDTSTAAEVSVRPTHVQKPPIQASVPPLPAPPHDATIGTGVAIPADDVPHSPTPPVRRPQPHQPVHSRPQQPYRRPHPPIRIDTCIVGDDSTCDQAQNEKCRTESGISSCQCRPSYARRTHRDPCRRVVSLLLNLRVDRLYDRKVVWDLKLADKESDPYQQLSFEAIRAMQESPETLRTAVATEIQKHVLGVIRRRSNNVGASALYVDTPAGSVLPLRGTANSCHFDSDNQHFRCFAHILNLGVQDLLKTLALHCETDTNAQDQQYEDYADETEEDEEDEEYAPNIADSRTSVTKLRSISSKIKRSEIVKKKFQSACEAAGVPSNLNPILDCPMRWNSTHDMIGFGLKVRAGINILCSSVTELNDFQITASEWQILEKIHKFLINFKLLSTKLGGEKMLHYR